MYEFIINDIIKQDGLGKFQLHEYYINVFIN